MQIGISTATYFGKLLTEDSFKQISYCGAQIAEVFLTTYSEYEKKFAKILNEQRGEVKIHSIHTLNSQFEPQLYNKADRTREDAEKIFKKALAVGKAIDAKYYTFHGPARLKRFKETKFDFENLARRTAELYDIAKHYGIELSYENVHWAYYYYPGYFQSINKYCNLKGTLDIKQAFQSHADYKDFIKDIGRNISTVHVCDYDHNYKLCPIGKGTFDFKELIAILKDNGIDVPIIIELYCGDYESFDEVKQSYEYLKSLI